MNLRIVSIALLWIGFHLSCSGCRQSEDVDSGASCEEAKRNLDAHRDSLNHCESDDDCTVVGWARSSCECGSTFQIALNTEERAKYSNTIDIVFSAECGSDGQECDDYEKYGSVQCREGRCGWPDYSRVTCNPSSCNPVTQAGCAVGQKCAENILSAAPFLAKVACVPDGVVAQGEACVNGEPGADTGFDNCQAGLDCFADVCAEICHTGPDTCRFMALPLPFDQGEYCVANFQDHFNSETGICLSACNPTDDTAIAGIIVNAGCVANESCGFDAITGRTSCLATPAESATQTQNEIPYGPGPGQVFSNGCASGFTTLLPSTVGTPVGPSQCARFCTPNDSYLSAANAQVGTPTGTSGKCETTALNLVGGVNGHDVAHQCRFIQAIYSDAMLSPDSLGMCMPIVPQNGGDFVLSNGVSVGASFGDCSLFEWEGLRDAWNAAAPSGEIAANIAFNQFCLSNPADPANSTLLPRCIGFFFGCVSLATEDEMITPTMSLTPRRDATGQGAASRLRSRLGHNTLKNKHRSRASQHLNVR